MTNQEIAADLHVLALEGHEVEHDPIGNMINHIHAEMCEDCLKDDYNFKNPFFLSLVKAYIEVLFYEHGDNVPVNFTMVKAVLKYDLCNYYIIAKSETDEFIVCECDVHDYDDSYKFYLTPNYGGSETE